MKTLFRLSNCRILPLLIAVAPLADAAETGKTFATPEEAAQALATAAQTVLTDTTTKNREALRALFGLATDELVPTDQVQAANAVKKFVEEYNAGHRLVPRSETEKVLEIGKDNWPFPIPLAKKDGRWFFDTEAGKQELLNRRIGENELSTLGVVRTYVQAQIEYASRDRIGNEVLQYAQKIVSSQGKKDGLYWPLELDGEMSPLGPFVAKAQGEGYQKKENEERTPYHGYYFRILTRQGSHAPGGRYDYVINGNMIAGFALIAWPADYGESGIMTFIVNQQGRVYQKDLGPKTEKLAPAIKEYDPDQSWQLSAD
jgi:hypothetical protein